MATDPSEDWQRHEDEILAMFTWQTRLASWPKYSDMRPPSNYYITLTLIGLTITCFVWQLSALSSRSSSLSSSTNSNTQKLPMRHKSASLESLLDNSTWPKKYSGEYSTSSYELELNYLLEFQAYLERYGYVDQSKTDEGAQMVGVSANNLNKNEQNEVAVLLLQKTLNLPMSGRISKTLLDSTSKDLRCGNVDFNSVQANGQQSSSSSNSGYSGRLSSGSGGSNVKSGNNLIFSSGSCGPVHQDVEQYSSSDFERPDRFAKKNSDNVRRLQRDQPSRKMNYRIAEYSKHLDRYELDRLVGRAFDRWAIEAQSNLHFVQVDERGFSADSMPPPPGQDGERRSGGQKEFQPQEVQIEIYFNERRIHRLELLDGKICKFSPIELAQTFTINGISEIHINDELFSGGDQEKFNHNQMSTDSSWSSNKMDVRVGITSSSTMAPIDSKDDGGESGDMSWGESSINFRRRSTFSGPDNDPDTRKDNRSGMGSKSLFSERSIDETMDDVLDSRIDSEIQQVNGRSVRFRRWIPGSTTPIPTISRSSSTSSPLTRSNISSNLTTTTGNSIIGTLLSNIVNTNNSNQLQMAPPTTPIGQVIAQYGPQVVAHVSRNPQIIQKLLPLLQQLKQNPQFLQQVLQTLQTMNIDTGDIIRQVTNLAHSGAIDIPKLIQAVSQAANDQQQQQQQSHSNSNNNNQTSSSLSIFSDLPNMLSSSSSQSQISPPPTRPTPSLASSSTMGQNETGAYNLATRFIQAQLHQGHHGGEAHQFGGANVGRSSGGGGSRRRSSIQGMNGIDLESLLAHEIGHAIGLGHNLRDKNSIMYPYFSSGWKNNTRDDIEAILALYGKAEEFHPSNKGNHSGNGNGNGSGTSSRGGRSRGSGNGERMPSYNGPDQDLHGKGSYSRSSKGGGSLDSSSDSYGGSSGSGSGSGSSHHQGGSGWRDIVRSMPEPLSMGKTLTPFQQMQQQQPSSQSLYRSSKSR